MLGRALLPLAARLPYPLLVALLLVRFADEWVTFFPAGAIEQIRADLAMPYAAAGLVLASLGAGGLVGNGLHVAADYVDRRLLAVLGALGVGLCLFVFALSHALAPLLVAGVLWGAASDAVVAGAEITLIDVYHDAVATVLGRVNAYGALGDLLAPATLIAAAALGFGWRDVFALGGGAMLLYAAWLGHRRYPRPRPPAVSRSPVAAVAVIARDRRVLLLAAVDGLYALLDEPLQGFLIAYFQRVRGLSVETATGLVGVAIVAEVIGFLAVPTFARFAQRAVLLALGAVVAVAVALLVAAPLVPALAAAAVAFGFAGAVFYTILQDALFALHPGQAGTTGAVTGTIGLVGLAYPVLVGAVADAHGLTAGLALYAAVPVVMLVLVLADRQ